MPRCFSARALVLAGLLATPLTGCSVLSSSSSTAPAVARHRSAAARRHAPHAHRDAHGPYRRVTPSQAATKASQPARRLALITEPQAGVAPVLDAIRGARRAVDLVMYEDEDTRVDAVLAADQARGVNVRVLLNGGYYGAGANPNQAAYHYLRAHSVPVHWTPSYFALTHQKTLVIDGRAYVLTFNFTPRYYVSSRDFGVIDSDADDVAAIEHTFDADFSGQRITAPDGRDLVWSPGSERRQAALIDSARGSLDVYNEEMDSAPIEWALEAAARRGVDVRVTMTYESDWRAAFTRLTADGVHVRTYSEDAPLYIHAKMILTPSRAFLGSENFSYTSLERNRELGIVFMTPTLIRSLSATFDRDYARARPFGAEGTP